MPMIVAVGHSKLFSLSVHGSCVSLALSCQRELTGFIRLEITRCL